jgi:nucleoside-diphosphate-sugar epimerase
VHVLVTGGGGFVLGATLKHLLDTVPAAHFTVLDVAEPNATLAAVTAGHRTRVTTLQRDVRSPEAFADLCGVTHVIHGATVTHHPDWERRDPRIFVDVNVTGTLNALEWARRQPSLRRFVHVSSGAVYGTPSRWSPKGPQDEDGPFNPPELYAISKYAAEQIARRYGELFLNDVVVVRLSDVFGPMERPTPGRRTMSLPYQMMRAYIERRPLCVTARTLQARGDFISSEDIARAIAALLHARAPSHRTYNVAYGRLVDVRALLDVFAALAEGFSYRTIAGELADADLNPDDRLARHNAYSVDRIARDVGWHPRPIEEQLASYRTWVLEEPSERCCPSR